jgi:hypothetical protein
MMLVPLCKAVLVFVRACDKAAHACKPELWR